MVIFQFILYAQICTQVGCYPVPQIGSVQFNSMRTCQQYKNEFISMANLGKLRYVAKCEDQS